MHTVQIGADEAEAGHTQLDPALAHHFDSLEQQHHAATLGMWIFLVTEVMIFGPILVGYAVYRSTVSGKCIAISAISRCSWPVCSRSISGGSSRPA